MVGEVKPIYRKVRKGDRKESQKKGEHCSWVCGADKSLWPTTTRLPRPPLPEAG